MTRHTRGQWHAVGWMVEHAGDEVADICCCNPAAFGQEPPRVKQRSYEEMWANAIVIANAPEMLITLERIVASPDDETRERHIDVAAELVRDIRKRCSFRMKKK
jgi:hypothetical protein